MRAAIYARVSTDRQGREDLAVGRRVGVVNNLHVLARRPEVLPAAA